MSMFSMHSTNDEGTYFLHTPALNLIFMCNFSVPFNGSSQDVLSRARSAVQNQGGVFNGNETGGAFQISVMGSAIRGTYAVSGQNLMINIESKPFLIPCSTIESFLRGQLG